MTNSLRFTVSVSDGGQSEEEQDAGRSCFVPVPGRISWLAFSPATHSIIEEEVEEERRLRREREPVAESVMTHRTCGWSTPGDDMNCAR